MCLEETVGVRRRQRVGTLLGVSRFWKEVSGRLRILLC
jgi:hypothetical protein